MTRFRPRARTPLHRKAQPAEERRQFQAAAKWHPTLSLPRLRIDTEAASILRGILLEKLAKEEVPQRLKADSYLQILRHSINLQASELQNHFTHLDLKSSLPTDEN